ncbi:hypothetical protein P4597_15230 [Peribacillus simplex]|nr:hypothetical protein [Peribacillus simplex]
MRYEEHQDHNLNGSDKPAMNLKDAGDKRVKRSNLKKEIVIDRKKT